MFYSTFFTLLASALPAMAVTYMEPATFIAGSFTEEPAAQVVWLGKEEQQVAKEILGHPYQGLRVRYWTSGDKTAWILDEIGKEKPITTGIVVSDTGVERVTILAFRESRGGEVRHPFFTAQFAGVSLDDNLRLNESIDGISGATMSVSAVSNVTRLALYLHSKVRRSGQYAASR
ncbi:MAG: FMN-binding protein [Pseudomonadales bacterium]|nr:FMN-binding protein [Pseudomonadales bacterium]